MVLVVQNSLYIGMIRSRKNGLSGVGNLGRDHTAEYDTFIKSQLASHNQFSGLDVVQIWSRNTPESGPNETFVLHRAETSRVMTVKFSDYIYIDVLIFLLK